VKETRTSENQRRRQYRAIYELLFQNPRIYIKTISSKLGADPAVTGRRMKEAFDLGYIAGPEIRKRSYANLKEYMYFVNYTSSVKPFLTLMQDETITYHAAMSGFANFWIMSKEEIDVEGGLVVGGPRSDYYMSFAPGHSWETALQIMRRKVDTFHPRDHEPKGIIKTRWDEKVEWNAIDEILFREFKHNLRKKLSPVMKKHQISGEKLYEWLGRLPECCTITTSFFPDGFSTYDSYLFMFSELPTSSFFFKVSGRLFLYAQVSGRLVRFVNIQDSRIGQLQIPLLMEDLLERGILKSEAHAIMEYDWWKNL
jgi:DNA-binding Lrp family transcriptional regulator